MSSRPCPRCSGARRVPIAIFGMDDDGEMKPCPDCGAKAESPLETARRVWPGEWSEHCEDVIERVVTPQLAVRVSMGRYAPKVLAHLVQTRGGAESLDRLAEEWARSFCMERLLIDARTALAAWLSPMVAAVQAIEPADPAVMELPPPLPIGPEVWPELLARVAQGTPLHRSMLARQALCAKRYGTPLRRDNGRPTHVDAFQECLDLLVYLELDWMRATASGDKASARWTDHCIGLLLNIAFDLKERCGDLA